MDLKLGLKHVIEVEIKLESMKNSFRKNFSKINFKKLNYCIVRYLQSEHMTNFRKTSYKHKILLECGNKLNVFSVSFVEPIKVKNV